MLLFMSRYWKLKKHAFEYLFAMCPLRHTQKNETEEMHCGKTWILWYGKQNKTKQNKIKKKRNKNKDKEDKTKQNNQNK